MMIFVDDDDLDRQARSHAGTSRRGGDGPAPTLGTDDGPAIISASNRARAAAAAAASDPVVSLRVVMKRQIRRSLDFCPTSTAWMAHTVEAARIIRYDHTGKSRKRRKPKKSSGRKDGSDDSSKRSSIPSSPRCWRGKKTGAAAQLKEVNIHTGLVTKSGAKSKAVLEKEAREAAERKRESIEKRRPFRC